MGVDGSIQSKFSGETSGVSSDEAGRILCSWAWAHQFQSKLVAANQSSQQRQFGDRSQIGNDKNEV